MKLLILYLLFVKLVELYYTDNVASIGSISNTGSMATTSNSAFFPSYDRNKFADFTFLTHSVLTLACEVLIVLASFYIFQLNGQVLEFNKKYITTIIIYGVSSVYNFNTYATNNTYLFSYIYLFYTLVSTVITIDLVILTICANKVFFSKLSKFFTLKIDREDTISEHNIQKQLIKEYSKSLTGGFGLYEETNRVVDLYKVQEIVQKIRINRK